MTTPDSDVVEVALEALATDARAWRGSAQVLHKAGQAANSYSLTNFHMGYLAGLVDVTNKYAEVQALAVRLLGEGTAAMCEFADVLDKVAEDYLATDTASAGTFVTIEGPR
ncbi:hypothetical protein QQG74_06955 [Micromonospora sp. FIMYZ51]|uniref:hypothetical protein n=1 Tax=Micromonospora sp. FIMYZ51 TaxID=3051832 RepID=UPI00312009BC